MVYSGGRYVNYRYNAEGSLAELDYGEGDAAPTATYRFEYDSPSTDSGDAIACNNTRWYFLTLLACTLLALLQRL